MSLGAGRTGRVHVAARAFPLSLLGAAPLQARGASRGRRRDRRRLRLGPAVAPLGRDGRRREELGSSDRRLSPEQALLGTCLVPYPICEYSL